MGSANHQNRLDVHLRAGGYGGVVGDPLQSQLTECFVCESAAGVIQQNFYPERLLGNPLDASEIASRNVSPLDKLMLCEKLSEGQSLAALLSVPEWLKRYA